MSDTLHCDWKEDEDGNWDTLCERYMVFEYAPPHEQGYNFCHHCGKPIHFIKFTYIEEQPWATHRELTILLAQLSAFT